MEAAGIEPASEKVRTRASTRSLGRRHERLKGTNQMPRFDNRVSHVLGFERHKFDVVTLLAIVKDAVVDPAQIFRKQGGLDEIAMDGGPNARVLYEALPRASRVALAA